LSSSGKNKYGNVKQKARKKCTTAWQQWFPALPSCCAVDDQSRAGTGGLARSGLVIVAACCCSGAYQTHL